MSRPKAAGYRSQIDPDLIPGQGRASGGTILLRLFLVLVAVFGAGLAIALVSA